MKVAFIGQKGIPATYGGIEDYVEKIATRLVRKGHEVTVFCRPHYSSTSGWYKGVRVPKVASIPTKHLDAISHTLFCSIHSLSRSFDLINFQALGPSSLCFIPKLSGTAKIIVTIHSLDWQRDKWNRWAKLLLKAAEYPAVHFPDEVAVVSESLKRYFEDKFRRKVVKVPTGVDAPVFRKPDKIKRFGLDKDNFILFLNRLVPEKGCHLLIRAFRELETDKKLFIAGDGKFSEDYKRKLHRWKSEKIIFGGYVEKDVLEELYSNCYLYVLPSMIEGVSQTVLQALSYGRAVLVSDIKENLDAVGNFGFSFRNKDVKDLKEKLRTLLRNKDLVTGQKKQRRDYIRVNFSWDKAAESLEDLFRSCLNGRAVNGNQVRSI